MNDTDDREQLAEFTPAPSVVEGTHRQELKARLLERMRKSEMPARTWRSALFARPAKVAAAFLAAVILVGTGWAAERVHTRVTRFFTIDSFTIDIGAERLQESKKALPDGSEMSSAVMTGTMVGSDDPDFTAESKKAQPDGSEMSVGTGVSFGFGFKFGVMSGSDDPDFTEEKARRQHEEVKRLISEGKYELVKTVRSGSDGEQYIYRFTLADGQQYAEGFLIPLEEVRSWEEYNSKLKSKLKHDNRRIQEAIAQGRFRLINVDVIKAHICRDPDSEQKLHVMQITPPTGEQMAFVNSHPLHESKGGYQVSWQDHLSAIAQGTRELIDIHIVNSYTYEITLSDGSTTTFNYGGDVPLSRLKEYAR